MASSTSIAKFFEWIVGQIPKYIDKRIVDEVGKIEVTNGKDGVSVVDTYIAADKHLVVKLSNGDEIDAGDISGLYGFGGNTVINTQLANNQITISAVAPDNPVVGQLWYDIS